MNGSANGGRSWASFLPVLIGIVGGIITGVVGWNFNELSNIKDSINKIDDRLIKLETLTVTPQEHTALRTLVESNRERIATFDARLTHVEQDLRDQRDEQRRQK